MPERFARRVAVSAGALAATRVLPVVARARSARRRALSASVVARTEELSGTGSVAWDVRNGRLIWSPNLYRIHGVDPSTFVPSADSAMELVHEEDRAAVSQGIAQALAGDGTFSMSYRIVTPEGSVRDLDWRGTVERDAAGFPRWLDGAIRDVSEQRRAERWLIASESRYRLIVENASDGIWVLDGDGRSDFVNSRLCQMLGRAPEELLGRSPAEFTNAEGAATLAEAGDAEDHVEVAFTRADGSPVWTAVSTSRYESELGSVQVHVLTDLSQRHRMEEQLRHAAERDRLTGIWNRAKFEDLLAQEMGQEGSAGPTAIVIVNLDHFKYINDSLGHHVGDRLLQRASELFGVALREGDELARLGGDEFGVLVRGGDQRDAIHVAERLLNCLREARWRGMSSLSASAGVAVATPGDHQLTPGNLVVAADIALQQAKMDGRNRLAVYTGERGGLTWLEEIREAIQEERLVLHSQAIIPLAGGRRSEELLVRMVGRDGHLIPPAAFIPPAEQFGLIVEIDRWVVAQALVLAADGRAVEVNLSGGSLGDAPIREAVEAAIAAGVDPGLLTFEITETAAARNLDVARDFAQALCRLGCAFAIDDFGTGFGSLIYLRHLPISRVKIDMQFVKDMLTARGDERVVEAIVGTARAMGQETVAEGVEDGPTLERLREMGVDYAQGFHIQRPGPLSVPAQTRTSRG